MSIEDTSKTGVHPEWLGGGNPDAIERQEKEGQGQLVASSQLPQKDGCRRDMREKMEAMGIEITSRGVDGLFYDTKLPDGWKVEPTEHDMWSRLFDAKGQEIARIFYKAAFYDRSAYIVFGNLLA